MINEYQQTQNYQKRYRDLMEIMGRSPEEITLCLNKKEKDLVQKRRLEIPDIAFMITSRCRLNCKECAALTPRLPNKTHLPIGQLISPKLQVMAT